MNYKRRHEGTLVSTERRLVVIDWRAVAELFARTVPTAIILRAFVVWQCDIAVAISWASTLITQRHPPPPASRKKPKGRPKLSSHCCGVAWTGKDASDEAIDMKRVPIEDGTRVLLPNTPPVPTPFALQVRRLYSTAVSWLVISRRLATTSWLGYTSRRLRNSWLGYTSHRLGIGWLGYTRHRLGIGWLGYTRRRLGDRWSGYTSRWLGISCLQ